MAVESRLPGLRYAECTHVCNFIAIGEIRAGDIGPVFSEAIDRIEKLPGVVSVGATTALPLSRHDNGRYFTIEGRAGDNPADYTLARHRQVSRDYFRTLEIGLKRGRSFDTADFISGNAVVIINQSFANLFFPNQDPIGKRLKMGEDSDSPFPWMTVIGVVNDVKHSALDARPSPELYRPFLNNEDTERHMSIVVRASVKPESLTSAIRKEVLSLDPNQPISDIATMDQLRDESTQKRRFSLDILGVFALAALILAAMGIYSVVSYTVSQNTREFGIRIALGAERLDVLKLVLGRGMLLTLIGVTIGLLMSFALTRVIAGQLYGVAPTDLVTFISTSVFVSLSSLLACYVPARRATMTDPIAALRYE